ncbi:MAG: hypothetical protein WAL83_11475, partial [Arenicellales bacterium]
MSEISIFPVFPHTIAVCTLEDSEVDADALAYVQGLEYVDTAHEKAQATSLSSANFDVLENLPVLKKSVL